MSVCHFQKVLTSFQVVCRDQVGINVFASQELPQNLHLLQTFPLNGDITRFIDVYGGITYPKRTVISSDTLLFIEESSVVQIRYQTRDSYFTEMLVHLQYLRHCHRHLRFELYHRNVSVAQTFRLVDL